MKKLGLLTAAVLAATTLGAAAPVHANSCTYAGLGRYSIGSGDTPTVYIDDRGVTYGTWIYLETNNIHDLQRGGTTVAGTETDPCYDGGTPDTLVF
jgi:hypothetical protein